MFLSHFKEGKPDRLQGIFHFKRLILRQVPGLLSNPSSRGMFVQSLSGSYKPNETGGNQDKLVQMLLHALL